MPYEIAFSVRVVIFNNSLFSHVHNIILFSIIEPAFGCLFYGPVLVGMFMSWLSLAALPWLALVPPYSFFSCLALTH
jgi:hypothetical protein